MNDAIKGRPNRINNTTAQTGNWNYVTALVDTTIASISSKNATANGAASNFAGMVIPAGVTIRLEAESIQLTAGDLWAYHE